MQPLILFFLFIATSPSVQSQQFLRPPYPVIPRELILDQTRVKPIDNVVLDVLANRNSSVILESPILQIAGLAELRASGAFSCVWRKEDKTSMLLLSQIIPLTISQHQADSIRQKLVDQYGTNQEGEITARWVDGSLEQLEDPVDTYFGKASYVLSCDTVSNGVFQPRRAPGWGYVFPYRATMQFCRDTRADGVVVGRADGVWHDTRFEYNFRCLERYLNSSYRPSRECNNFFWLLTTDTVGRSRLTPLAAPSSPAGKQVESRVVDLVENLPRFSFGFLITADKKLYSGRFIEASYSLASGWQLAEIIDPLAITARIY